MSFMSKIEVGAPQVKNLQKMIEANRSIEGANLVNFPCFGCNKIIPNARVRISGAHKANCLWNYHVHCSECDYQSSLAKFVNDYECPCN